MHGKSTALALSNPASGMDGADMESYGVVKSRTEGFILASAVAIGNEAHESKPAGESVMLLVFLTCMTGCDAWAHLVGCAPKMGTPAATPPASISISFDASPRLGLYGLGSVDVSLTRTCSSYQQHHRPSSESPNSLSGLFCSEAWIAVGVVETNYCAYHVVKAGHGAAGTFWNGIWKLTLGLFACSFFAWLLFAPET
ncbi:hypothetical protein HDV62DRAFT_384693 [Trichoderma sp. SZMC 28011]